MSMHRGHEIEEINGVWYYSDTGEPTAGNRRDCGHCNKPDTHGGHDPCLGTLRGVMNACCGHGESESAYVQFDGSTNIKGAEAVRYFASQIDRYKYCTCPKGTKIQSYSNARNVQKPFGRMNNVFIDNCIYIEILWLWSIGIETSGCCCGHRGKYSGYVGVTDEFIPKMKELGYIVQHNPCRPGDEDQFYLFNQFR